MRIEDNPLLQIDTNKERIAIDKLLGTKTPQSQQPQQDIQDGDTVNHDRITGYDTFESFTGSSKAKKLESEYGISFADQKRLGDRGTQALKENIDKYRLEATGDYGTRGRAFVKNEALTELMIREGNAVPTSRYDEKAQAVYRKAQEKRIELGDVDAGNYDAQREYNIQHGKPSYIDRLGESVDAFQSGALQALGSAGDVVGHGLALGADVLGAKDFAEQLRNTRFDSVKAAEVADEITGYDRREANFQTAEALSEWKQGNYLTAIGTALASPEIVAESLPLMIETMLGTGKFAKAGKVANFVGKNLGLGLVIAQETNTDVEEFTKNNNGIEPSAGQIARMTAVNTAIWSLDRLTFKQLIKGKEAITEVVATLPKSTKREIFDKSVTAGLAIGGGIASEGAQEYVQTWGEILNVNYEAEGKTIVDVLNDAKNQEEALTGGIMGAGAGGQIKTVSTAANILKTEPKTEEERAVRTPLDIKMRELSAQKEQDSNVPLTNTEKAEVEKLFGEQLEATNELTDPEMKLTQNEAMLATLESTIGEEVFGESTEANIVAIKTEIETLTKEIEDAKLQSVVQEEAVDTPVEATDAASEEAKMDAIEAEEDLADSIQAVADKIVAGEELTAEDLQVQQNEGKAIEAKLAEAKTESEPKVETKVETKSETPGPLRAFANKFKDILVQKKEAVIAEAPTFKKRIKNAAGKLVEVLAGKRKLEKRVSEPLYTDDNFIDIFKEGDTRGKISDNAKANKKQLGVISQSKLARSHKSTLLSKVSNLIKGTTISKSTEVNDDFKALFTETDGSINEGGAVRLAIAGLHHVIEDIKSNVDRTNKAGFVNDILYASRQNIAKEIGRTFVSSYGHNLVAAEGNSDEAIDRHYIEIGNVAIDMLREMGYIEHYEGNEGFADTGFQEIYTEDNKRIETETTTLNKQEVPKISGDNVILLKEDLIETKGKTENKTSKSVNSSLSEMLSPIMAVMDPGNKRDPEHEASTENIEGKDHKVSKNFNNIVLEIAGQPMYIKPDTLALLQEVVELTKTKSLDELIKGGKHNWIKTMFDLDKKDDVLATEKNSVSGKYTSRIGNAQAIIQAVADSQNLDGDVDVSKLFYTYFSAVNQRIHADEISFNFQADNYFTRHILSPVDGTYETSTIEENQTLIRAVADELGIDPKDVMSDTGNYEEDSAEDGMNVIIHLGETDNLKWMLDPKQVKDSQFAAFFGSSKSPVSAIKTVQAVKAIREAVAEANGDWKKAKIKSNYAVEFDGNTSGLVNKLLNMLGGSDTHEALFDIIKGLTVADENGKLGDGYTLLSSKVIELLNIRLEKAKGSRRKSDIKDVKSIEKLIEFINTTKGAMRLVSKEPMMTNIYGQMEASLARGLGLSMSGQLLDSAKIGSKNQKEAMDTIEILFKRINSSHDVNLTQKREMADTIGDLLGGIFSEALADINRDLDTSTEPIYRSYKLMQNVSKYAEDFKLEMRSPFDVVWAAIYPESAEKGAHTDEFNFPISKRKITAVGESIVGAGSVIPTQEKFLPNQNSQRVMPLHAIDTAILLLAYEGTLRALGYIEGSMPIHDAVYSTPAFMNEYKKQYNKAAIDVARHYDLINETSVQIEAAIKALEGKDGTTVLIKELNKINDEINGEKEVRLERKSEALDFLGEKAEVFGTFKNTLDDAIVEQKADPKPKPKVVPKKTEDVKPEPAKAEPVATETYDNAFDSAIADLDAESAKIMTEFMEEISKETKDTEKAIALLESLVPLVNADSIQHINTLKGFLEADGKTKIGKNFEYIPESDTVVIETGTVKDSNDLLKYLTHEVEHKSTAQYLFEQSNKVSTQQDPAYKFAKRVMERFTKMSADNIANLMQKYDTELDSFGENIGSRIDYIYSQQDEYHQMAEFVAIYRTNPEFRDMINKEIMPNKSVMSRFIQSIRQIVNSGMRKFTQNGDIAELTMDSLNDAMHDIVSIGHQRRLDVLAEGKGQTAGTVQAQKKNLVGMIDETLEYKPYKGVEPLFFLPIETVIGKLNNHIKHGINMGAIKPGAKLVNSKWVQDYHKKGMTRTEGMYYKTVTLLQEQTAHGTLLSKILVDMQLTEGFDYETISQLHTIWNKAQQARNQVDSDMLVKSKEAYDKLTKDYSEDEKDTINSIFNKSLIHVLAEDENGNHIIDLVLNSDNRAETIKEQIVILEKELTTGTSKIMDQSFKDYGVGRLAKDIANFYRTGKLGDLADGKIGSHYVMKTLGQDKLYKFNQLTALYQLQNENLDTMVKFKEDSAKKGNEDMYKEFMYISRANATISLDADQDIQGRNQYKFDSATGSHVLFEENYEFKSVNMNTFENLIEDEENKWIILQMPDPSLKRLGLVARIRDDFGKQAGIVSHTNLNSDGIPVTKDDLGSSDMKTSNIMQSGVGGQYEYKIMLTNEMLKKLKVRKNASSSLYRSYGHNKEIIEGKTALKHILENESVIVKDTKDAAKLEKMLKGGKKPMFLNLDLKTLTKEDYPLIYDHYIKTNGLTNVLGFNKRVNMVHKDLEDQFVGYTKAPMFDKRHVQLRKAETILRHAVTMFKGHVVMGNPGKIGMDAMSNASILLANNVPMKSIYLYGREAAKMAPEMVKMRNALILLELQVDGTKKGTKAHDLLSDKIKKSKEEIQNHPFSAALNNGFIQSLSTSMMMKDKETMGGLQKSLNQLFKRIDDVPYMSKIIFEIANRGLTIEEVLEFAAKGTKDGTPLDVELKHIANKFRKIKSDKDIAAYLSEFVASPSQSELLRIGGMATLGVDLMSKWVLYKHTMDEMSEPQYKGMSQAEKEKRAVSLALNSFVDYRRNLPRELDFLSDVGIWMFPQFTLRIQKVIWALAYNKAIGSGTGVATAVLAGHMNGSIFGSALPFKDLAHLDGFDANMIYPAELF